MMDRKMIIAVALVAVAAVAVAAVLLMPDGGEKDSGGDSTETVTATVWLDDGSGEPVSSSGSGSTIEEIVTSALEGREIVFRSNGTVESVDGVSGTDGSRWTIFKWASPNGWEAYNYGSGSCIDEMNVALKLSDKYIDDEGRVSYRAPDIEVEYKVYFFFQVREHINDTEWLRALPLTDEEKQKGLWIAGTGSNANDALAEAVRTTFFPDLEFEVVEGKIGNDPYVEYIVDGKEGFSKYGLKQGSEGWFLCFLGWGDTKISDNGEYGDWTYWPQFNYSPDAESDDNPQYWEFNQDTFARYDITKYRCFGVTLMTTEAEPGSMDVGFPAPSTIPEGL